jgi:hypothetical protein
MRYLGICIFSAISTYDMVVTENSNEMELLVESRGNCVLDNFRNATSSLLSGLPIIIPNETRLSETHPGVASASSSLPQSSPWLQYSSARTTILMLSIIF